MLSDLMRKGNVATMHAPTRSMHLWEIASKIIIDESALWQGQGLPGHALTQSSRELLSGKANACLAMCPMHVPSLSHPCTEPVAPNGVNDALAAQQTDDVL